MNSNGPRRNSRAERMSALHEFHAGLLQPERSTPSAPVQLSHGRPSRAGMVAFEMKGKAAADKARASVIKMLSGKEAFIQARMASMSFRRWPAWPPGTENQRRRFLSMPTTLKPLRANRWTLSEPIQPQRRL